MKAQIVSFHCVLKNKLGQILSSSFNQDVINQLDENDLEQSGQRLRGLVAGIQNVVPGEKRQFTVYANDAYGPYHPDLVISTARSELSMGDSLVIGSEVTGKLGPKGPRQAYRVVQINDDTVVLDGNHPLAGHDLIFDIEIVSARDARDDDFEETIIASTPLYVH